MEIRDFQSCNIRRKPRNRDSIWRSTITRIMVKRVVKTHPHNISKRNLISIIKREVVLIAQTLLKVENLQAEKKI
jgi:hypothetical protein